MKIKPKWLSKFLPLIKIIRDSAKEAKFVGGCVRDAILGKCVNDFDIATNASPEFLMYILNKQGVKTIPTGLKHGTVTALWQDSSVEITTLRKDIKCDGRHAKIQFTDNWREDAKRRDFTFNALYLDVEGRVFDYFNGLEDLKNKRLRFVGDPKKRIEEDYLRILRAFRFHACLCTQNLDHDMLDACAKYKDKLNTISGERIWSEVKKLLSYDTSISELVTMQYCGVLQKICNFGVNFDKIDIKKTSVTNNPLIKLALVIKNCNIDSKVAAFWLSQRWKLAKGEYKKLTTLLTKTISKTPKKDLFDFGRSDAKDILILHYLTSKMSYEDFNSYYTDLNRNNIPEFPLRGRDIKNLGYNQGKEIGDIIKKLKSKWESSDYIMSKQHLLDTLKCK